jgi:hypothetical protein
MSKRNFLSGARSENEHCRLNGGNCLLLPFFSGKAGLRGRRSRLTGTLPATTANVRLKTGILTNIGSGDGTLAGFVCSRYEALAFLASLHRIAPG